MLDRKLKQLCLQPVALPLDHPRRSSSVQGFPAFKMTAPCSLTPSGPILQHGKLLAGRLLVSGLQLGNVWIGVQPALGVEGDPMRLLFERDLTPHPQYAVRRASEAACQPCCSSHYTLPIMAQTSTSAASFCDLLMAATQPLTRTRYCTPPVCGYLQHLDSDSYIELDGSDSQAFYKWIQDDFSADAVVHVGMHGTVEWCVLIVSGALLRSPRLDLRSRPCRNDANLAASAPPSKYTGMKVGCAWWSRFLLSLSVVSLHVAPALMSLSRLSM